MSDVVSVVVVGVVDGVDVGVVDVVAVDVPVVDKLVVGVVVSQRVLSSAMVAASSGHVPIVLTSRIDSESDATADSTLASTAVPVLTTYRVTLVRVYGSCCSASMSRSVPLPASLRSLPSVSTTMLSNRLRKPAAADVSNSCLLASWKAACMFESVRAPGACGYRSALRAPTISLAVRARATGVPAVDGSLVVEVVVVDASSRPSSNDPLSLVGVCWPSPSKSAAT